MQNKFVTFGEIMLRLAPNGYYRFFQNDQMQATFGGGEANVAVSLANFGLHSTYVTKLPHSDWMLLQVFPMQVTNEMLSESSSAATYLLLWLVFLSALYVLLLLF